MHTKRMLCLFVVVFYLFVLNRAGQSNPTFYIETADKRYVLRKKPPGELLPGAHKVLCSVRYVARCSITIM